MASAIPIPPTRTNERIFPHLGMVYIKKPTTPKACKKHAVITPSLGVPALSCSQVITASKKPCATQLFVCGFGKAKTVLNLSHCNTTQGA